MPTRIKICGITRIEDALAAAQLGADAIGLMFWPHSARYVTPQQARDIVAALPPFITAVGVYVNPDPAWVEETARAARLNLLQFHGDEAHETPQFCQQLGTQLCLPYLKAARVKAGMDLLQYAARYNGAQGLLLDAYVEGAPGGTGSSFDWNLIPASLPVPMILSGGLNAQNVATAIRKVRPYAVDVSSGVESAKGIKDKTKIAEFIEAARRG